MLPVCAAVGTRDVTRRSATREIPHHYHVHKSPPWTKYQPVESYLRVYCHYYFSKIRFNNYHLRLGLPNGLLHSSSAINIFYEFYFFMYVVYMSRVCRFCTFSAPLNENKCFFMPSICMCACGPIWRVDSTPRSCLIIRI